MTRSSHPLEPLALRDPLRVMFLLTSMPVGGAETLLVNLIRRLDRTRFAPQIACLKERGPLGEELAAEIPVHEQLLAHKYDLRIPFRLSRLLRSERIDAVVTVGAGDKMFWGRIAARRAGVPVVLSALHSTGWPDGIGRLNRCLTRWTDAFIAVAPSHGRFLVEQERLPQSKVRVIPNGVNVDRFRPDPAAAGEVRAELGLASETPLCGIVAALRPEKNHAMFLRAAARVRESCPAAHFLIIGDGPERQELEGFCGDLGLNDAVHFLGTRSDIPRLVAALDVFALTSHNEANPVSILEAMAAEVPIVATKVGSVGESVETHVTGFLVSPDDDEDAARQITRLLNRPELAHAMGEAGRAKVVGRWSLERMVMGYQELIREIYQHKSSALAPVPAKAAAKPAASAVATNSPAEAGKQSVPSHG